MFNLEKGTQFRGLMNGEVFEIVDVFERNKRVYYKFKHLKSGKLFEYSKQYVEHLQIEILYKGDVKNYVEMFRMFPFV
jgi:hypothetical protein